MDRGARRRALIVGWHGSRERHLRALARCYEARLGAEGEAIAIVPRTFDAMRRADGWAREGRRVAEVLARAERERGELPVVIHAFSNAGFWTARALLDAMSEAQRARHEATVLDSAPGFPERVSARFTARYASRAMLPGVMEALGMRPAHVHPVLTPPVAALLGAWHVIAPAQVRFMESSLAAMRAHHARVPVLLVWGGADELVPAALVERFAATLPRAQRLYFPDGEHVRHFVTHRQIYLTTLHDFLGTGSVS